MGKHSLFYLADQPMPDDDDNQPSGDGGDGGNSGK